jgi:hypothetical protein
VAAALQSAKKTAADDWQSKVEVVLSHSNRVICNADVSINQLHSSKSPGTKPISDKAAVPAALLPATACALHLVLQHFHELICLSTDLRSSMSHSSISNSSSATRCVVPAGLRHTPQAGNSRASNYWNPSMTGSSWLKIVRYWTVISRPTVLLEGMTLLLCEHPTEAAVLSLYPAAPGEHQWCCQGKPVRSGAAYAAETTVSGSVSIARLYGTNSSVVLTYMLLLLLDGIPLCRAPSAVTCHCHSTVP